MIEKGGVVEFADHRGNSERQQAFARSQLLASPKQIDHPGIL